ncbi:MAG: kynureninase [Zetaproteobacteria bacterium]|nr:kynureninase [Pseudobdellovibrionaceae bacterium]
MNFENTIAFAKSLDQSDTLASFQNQFHFPAHAGKKAIYFCGNSLGLQPKSTRAFIENELRDWESMGVKGHTKPEKPWVSFHELLAKNMGDVVGAKPDEVVMMNSLTTNLHLMMVSFYRPKGKRTKIVIEGGAFPSDQYAVKSQLDFHGLDPKDHLIELTPRKGENLLRTEDIVATINQHGESIALVIPAGVNYLTGQLYDLQAITKAAKACGACVGFDLAHAVGNVPLKLHDWGVDFAVWCSYKYLNSGPGGIAGCFMHESHSLKKLPRFEGWWGHNKEKRFAMGPNFEAIGGVESWQLSNPPIFQLASAQASLELFAQAGIENLRKKSLLLTGFLEFLMEKIPHSRYEIITPKNPIERGAQLSIKVHGSATALLDKLDEKGIICDFREPDIIRVAPAPLYNSFSEVFLFAEILRETLD